MSDELFKLLEKLLDNDYEDEITVHYDKYDINYTKVVVMPFEEIIYFILKPVDHLELFEANEVVCFSFNKKTLEFQEINDKDEISRIYQYYLEISKGVAPIN